MAIRTWRETDLPALQALNDAAVPAVNALSTAALRELLAAALAAPVAADTTDRPVGFAVCLAEGLDYASDNYRWFSATYDTFAYIDRAVVAADQRGCGLGGALYDAIEAAVAGHRPRLTCEVNLEPPNPGSLRFHQRRGFAEVGRQATDGGEKRVMLLAKRV